MTRKDYELIAAALDDASEQFTASLTPPDLYWRKDDADKLTKARAKLTKAREALSALRDVTLPLRIYVAGVENSYAKDPASSDYQQGYLDGLLELRNVARAEGWW